MRRDDIPTSAPVDAGEVLATSQNGLSEKRLER